ncbi:MAG: M24 family metallopeptidase [Alphaproteobacteria bacterium]|nr:M24 family metallopeptidase [Alphaproteobacteria bacterium]
MAQANNSPMTPAEKLAALRAHLAAAGLDGFIVPHADEHQNEFLPPRAERLAWLTGFSGSAGMAVILADRAAIFVDGRYTLQVRNQVKADLYSFHHLIEAPATDWVAENLSEGARLGYDPWLHGVRGVDRLRQACDKAGAELVAVDPNPVDAVWTDQPAPPQTPVVPHELRFAGRASTEKRAELAQKLTEGDIAATVLTQPDSIAWLFNVRGNDVSHTPLPLSFAILNADATVDWFVDPAKTSQALIAHLGNGVACHDPDAFGPALDRLGDAGARVQACPDTAASWVFDRLTAAGADIRRAADPVTLPKAIKNAVELDGTRAAHRRDGAALTRFLAWLAATAAEGEITEIGAVEKLAEIRSDGDLFRELSFDTISGAGPNGAIVHYRVSPETDRPLRPDELYLVDSGAQYLDGTTDVTRTVAIGAPSEEMRDRFTRVLKGHIAIALARFPKGTTGGQLDALARQYLWQSGLDYDHGTGHGVGSYLGVHEGPQRISKAGTGQALQAGMIVSNEPGYYKEGAYGIRIENLVAVVPVGGIAGGEREMLGFETLTLAPIDPACIEVSLLSADERAWLDAYHARVMTGIGPLVDETTRNWLAEVTQPLN